MTLYNAAPVNGRHSWEPYNATADGKPQIVAVLLEDSLQGRTWNDAYVTGSRGFLYCPIMGEELNVWFQNQTGTADDVAIGALFMLDDATGQLLAESSSVMAPWIAMETITDPVADQLLWCMYSGH